MRATSDPAFRTWHDTLRIPNRLDKDVLLAAGVIADDEDWLCWRDRGWLTFIVKASDAQEFALFELVQAELGRQSRRTPTRFAGEGCAA